jgi:YjjG family noncanonical pyrimidine nucleotidase
MLIFVTIPYLHYFSKAEYTSKLNQYIIIPMAQKIYKTLLFDLDNTLLDFTASEQHGLEGLYQHYFSNEIPKAAFLNSYEQINQKLWRQVQFGHCTTAQVKTERFKQLALKFNLARCEKTLAKHYEFLLVEKTLWLPGAKEALDELRQHYKIGIITNGITYTQQQKCAATGLSDWCSAIIISEEVGLAKPDPAIFALACQQLNTSAQDCLMFGDSLASDHQGAIKSKMDFCWVTYRNGYRESPSQKPHYKVQHVADMKDILIKKF